MKTIEVLQGQSSFNKLINGNFDIWERGTGFSHAPSGGSYGCDRWLLQNTGTSNIQITRHSDVPTLAESGYQSEYSSQVSFFTDTMTTAQYKIYSQRIEAFNAYALYGKNAYYSFWVKSSHVGNLSLYAYLQPCGFRYSTIIIDNPNVWERKTVDLGIIPQGALGTGNGLQVGVTLDAGPDLMQGTANEDEWLTSWSGSWVSQNQTNFSSLGATMYFSQAMVHEGKAPAETFVLAGGGPYSSELSLCQRYFERRTSFYQIQYGLAGQNAYWDHSFKVRKRTSPSMSLTSGTLYNTSAVSTSGVRADGFSSYCSPTGSGRVAWGWNANGAWAADAEL